MEMIRRERVVNVPNILTLVRIGLLPAVVWRFKHGDSIGALVVYCVSMLTDVFDGAVARRFNQITDLGKLLDPLADKLSLLVLLGLFASDGQISLWMILAVLIKEIILVAGSGFALHRGIVVSALPIGKVTTLLFVLSMMVRFAGWRPGADVLLNISLILSYAALCCYIVVVSRYIFVRNAVSTE